MKNYLIDLPVSDGTDFDRTIFLDGVKFVIQFRFNVRLNMWVFNLLSAGYVPIVQGCGAVVKYPLLLRATSELRPVGQLYLIDTSGKDEDPGPNDLGARVQLVYRTE
jgi:hypothetical protein